MNVLIAQLSSVEIVGGDPKPSQNEKAFDELSRCPPHLTHTSVATRSSE